MTLERAGKIPEMGHGRRVLHRSQFFISSRELALKSSIAGGVLCEAVEVLQTTLHDQRARRCRTGQVCHRIVHFKDERVCELSDFLEAPFRTCTLGARNSRLPNSRDNSSEQCKDDKHSGRNTKLMTTNKLAGPVTKRGRTRSHRQSI